MNNDNSTPATATSAAIDAKAQRRKMIFAVLGVTAAIGVAYGAYWARFARYQEATDNAYVDGNVVQITPQVAGTVVSIGADDTQFVKAGQVLVQLDKADAGIALQKAESQLAKSVRQVRNLVATRAQAQAEIAMRQSDLDRTQQDLQRRQRLASSGAISAEEVQHARDAAGSALAALTAARQQSVATYALLGDSTIEQQPDVQNAAAAVRDAYLSYSRTSLPAPLAGFIAKRNVQLGQHVNSGAPLMAVVPLDEVWVDANFKESQLANIRIGQAATLSADVYGGKVGYHGRVVGFGVGTGAAFSLLPAQNATGNWIKIVQRVPVRIALDARELAAHPLQIGLSMQVNVDTHERDGVRLPEVALNARPQSTLVFASSDDQAEARVKAVIAANDTASYAATLARDDGAANNGSRAERHVAVAEHGLRSSAFRANNL